MVIKRFFVYKCKLIADMSIILISVKINLMGFTEQFQIRKEFITPFEEIFP